MNPCVLLLALSHHALPGEFNEVHPGVMCQSDSNLFVSAYQNSEDSLSVALGYTFELDYGFEVEVGLVSGYEAAPVVPLARVTYGTDSLKGFAAPAVNWKGDVGFLFGIEYRIGG